MRDYSSTGNTNPDQLKSMLRLGRKKVGDGSFRTAIGQQAHHSMPAAAIRKIVGAGQSPYAPRRMDNIGASIAGSARTLGQQKKSIYRNPILAHHHPLDPSQVQDRRSERPLRRRDYPSNEAYKGGMQTVGSVNRAVLQAIYGAQDTEATAMKDVPLPKRKKLPPWAQGPGQTRGKK